MERDSKAQCRFAIVAAVVIAVVTFCVEIPFFHFGIPSGHDFEFHFNSWLEVVQHWKEGVFYPHWAALAHYGYGETRFIFYPPLSWLLGAFFGLALPWKLVSGAYIWFALTLAGVSMFVLARQWLSREEALFAAAFYAVNPYHLVIVYWRSALAELLAAAYLPLLLLFTLRLQENARRAIVPLALLLAAGWLTNVPGAVMMTYSVAVLAMCVAIQRKSIAPLAYGSLAILLGAALASVYLLPVLHQRNWVSLNQVLSPGVRPEDNFLFVITSDLAHNRFNLLVSIVALWEIMLVAASLFLARRSTSRLWWPLLGWSAVCIVLMLRLTLPAWTHLPELRYVQLPWRWLLCLNVPLALLVVIAFRYWWLRGLICAVALGSVLLAWQHLMVPWWDNAGDIKEMVDNQQDGLGNEGADEYVPAGADPYAIDQRAPLARFEGPGTAEIRVEAWHSEERRIVAKVRSPGKLVLRLFNYPSWKVERNSTPIQSQTAAKTGQMVVAVDTGENRIQISYVEGWDRWVGGVISIFTLVTLGLWSFHERRSTLKADG